METFNAIRKRVNEFCPELEQEDKKCYEKKQKREKLNSRTLNDDLIILRLDKCEEWRRRGNCDCIIFCKINDKVYVVVSELKLKNVSENEVVRQINLCVDFLVEDFFNPDEDDEDDISRYLNHISFCPLLFSTRFDGIAPFILHSPSEYINFRSIPYEIRRYPYSTDLKTAILSYRKKSRVTKRTRKGLN